jgi:hypothetical protein
MEWREKPANESYRCTRFREIICFHTNISLRMERSFSRRTRRSNGATSETTFGISPRSLRRCEKLFTLKQKPANESYRYPRFREIIWFHTNLSLRMERSFSRRTRRNSGTASELLSEYRRVHCAAARNYLR